MIYESADHYNQDRRGSAPDVVFQGFYGNSKPSSVLNQLPFLSEAYYIPPAQQSLCDFAMDLTPNQAFLHSHQSRLQTADGDYLYPSIPTGAISGWPTPELREGDHPPSERRASNTRFSLEYDSHYQDEQALSSPSPVEDSSPLSWSLSLDTTKAYVPVSPPSPLQSPTRVQRSRRESLETCSLEEPGCYVLIPTGCKSDSDAKQSSEDSKYNKDKKSLLKKNRKPMKDSEREAIKLNRKLGVCLRCKLFKEKCRGASSGSCDRCRSLRIWKNLCVPAVFTDKIVFSRDIYRLRVSLLLENIQGWDPIGANSLPLNLKYIEVHNGYLPRLTLEVHKFVPRDATLLEHILWRVTAKPDFSTHPSTCWGFKGELTRERFDEYLDQHTGSLIDEEEAAICDGLIIDTFKAAHRYTRSGKTLSSLVQKAFRVWIGQTFFFRSAWRLCGSDLLSMTPIHYPTSKKVHGVVPLPRLINQQLDFYLESRIAHLEKEVLEELQAHILDRNSLDWFGIYLTIFIILSTLERDTWSLNTWEHDSEMLHQRVQMLNFLQPNNGFHKAWIWPLTVTPAKMIEKNMHLAQTLVFHFRTVSRGYVPFTLDWDQKQTIQMVGGEADAIEYMKMMRKRVSKLESVLQERQNAEYVRDDDNSLTALFTSKLVIDEM